MNNFYHKVLKAFYKEPRSIDYLKKKFEKERSDRLEEALDFLEENLLIEEAVVPELEAIKNNLPIPEFCSDEYTGTYYITESGRQIVEERNEENIRFYLPFVVTTAISLISLVISIISIAIATAN